MFFQRFSYQVILRVVLLLATMTLFASIVGNEDLFFNQLILFSVIAAQTAELLRYLHLVNKELIKFLEAIRHHDFTLTFNKHKLGNTFSQLSQSFTDIIKAYEKVKIEKEAQYHFLEAIVQHLDVGIITLKKEQEIILMNGAAEEMLHMPRLKNWSHLKAKNKPFAELVEAMTPSGKRLLEMVVDQEVKQFSVNVAPLLLMEEPYVIITFHDINREIAQKEIEAWNKLIRTLTHEIMNSLTPVSSLTETMIMLLQDDEGQGLPPTELNEETIDDLLFSLKTIQSRNEGMLTFLDNYRKVARLPTPNLSVFPIEALFSNIRTLMQGELQKKSIPIQIRVAHPNMALFADQKLIEQVLINLVTNSLQALEKQDKPLIELHARNDDGGRTIIEVKDNGPGISPDKIDKVFIPFYSTKPGGSGIGLSLSRNIMNLHNGTLQVSSRVGHFTAFLLIFPKKG